MKAVRLPSGNWRVRVYLGEVDGKKKWKSVTAKTKAEVLREAALYEPKEDMSLLEACEKYLKLKGPELSPSTVRSYEATLRRYIAPSKLAAAKLSAINSAKAQEWLLSLPPMARKTKQNHFGFLSAVVSFFDEDKRLRVRIARTEEKDLYTPTMDEINRVLMVCDPETRLAAALACFGLRRGEICALEQEDIDRRHNTIRVTKALVKSSDNSFVVKTPKTKKSRRIVPVSRSVIDAIPTEGVIISCSPDSLTNRFAHAVKKAGVHPFRFHDLRSFFASIALSSAIGSGTRTVQDLGGWETDRVLKSHYERSISDQMEKDTEAIVSYFSDHLKMG